MRIYICIKINCNISNLNNNIYISKNKYSNLEDIKIMMISRTILRLFSNRTCCSNLAKMSAKKTAIISENSFDVVSPIQNSNISIRQFTSTAIRGSSSDVVESACSNSENHRSPGWLSRSPVKSAPIE